MRTTHDHPRSHCCTGTSCVHVRVGNSPGSIVVNSVGWIVSTSRGLYAIVIVIVIVVVVEVVVVGARVVNIQRRAVF